MGKCENKPKIGVIPNDILSFRYHRYEMTMILFSK